MITLTRSAVNAPRSLRSVSARPRRSPASRSKRRRLMPSTGAPRPTSDRCDISQSWSVHPPPTSSDRSASSLWRLSPSSIRWRWRCSSPPAHTRRVRASVFEVSACEPLYASRLERIAPFCLTCLSSPRRGGDIQSSPRAGGAGRATSARLDGRTQVRLVCNRQVNRSPSVRRTRDRNHRPPSAGNDLRKLLITHSERRAVARLDLRTLA